MSKSRDLRFRSLKAAGTVLHPFIPRLGYCMANVFHRTTEQLVDQRCSVLCNTTE